MLDFGPDRGRSCPSAAAFDISAAAGDLNEPTPSSVGSAMCLLLESPLKPRRLSTLTMFEPSGFRQFHLLFVG